MHTYNAGKTYITHLGIKTPFFNTLQRKVKLQDILKMLLKMFSFKLKKNRKLSNLCLIILFIF